MTIHQSIATGRDLAAFYKTAAHDFCVIRDVRCHEAFVSLDGVPCISYSTYVIDSLALPTQFSLGHFRGRWRQSPKMAERELGRQRQTTSLILDRRVLWSCMVLKSMQSISTINSFGNIYHQIIADRVTECDEIPLHPCTRQVNSQSFKSGVSKFLKFTENLAFLRYSGIKDVSTSCT